MGASGLLFKDVPNTSVTYHDLRDLQDDKTVLRNPHKGWYWHYIDNGFGSKAYRDQHDPNDFLLDFPGLNHLYLRFNWGDIEKQEGVCDWSYLDEIFEKWGRQGYRFSMRVCTYEASGLGSQAFATPEWVFKEGASCKVFHGAYEPDYGDPVFLEKLSEFMEKFGKRYNGNPLVEAIDIGTFGTWGEGHTGNGSDCPWPFDTMKAHIDLHARSFPDTFLLLNDDYINHRNECPNEENIRLMEYAARLGTGLRDDSVCVGYYCDNCGYNTLRTPFMFDHFWKQAPIDLELDHFTQVPDENFKSGFPFLSAMMRVRATFAGFHGYPRPWLEKYPDFTEYCANRLGYWYFIEGVDVPEVVLGVSNSISFFLTNRGFAPAYRKYRASIKLISGKTGASFEQAVEMDNTKWLPGALSCEQVKLKPTGIVPGEYELYFGLFENSRPIKLGIKPDYKDENGYYRLAKVRVTI